MRRGATRDEATGEARGAADRAAPRIAFARSRRNASRRRFVLACAFVALEHVALPRVARADVVPPEAVAVAEGWFELVDRGRIDEAVARYAEPAAVDALRRRLRDAAPRHRPIRRTILRWAGHGGGDTLRMAPGAWFALDYDAVDVDGTAGVDEIRMRPDGRGGWRVVDAVRDPPPGE